MSLPACIMICTTYQGVGCHIHFIRSLASSSEACAPVSRTLACNEFGWIAVMQLHNKAANTSGNSYWNYVMIILLTEPQAIIALVSLPRPRECPDVTPAISLWSLVQICQYFGVLGAQQRVVDFKGRSKWYVTKSLSYLITNNSTFHSTSNAVRCQ